MLVQRKLCAGSGPACGKQVPAGLRLNAPSLALPRPCQVRSRSLARAEQRLALKAATEEAISVASDEGDEGREWVPVCRPEELPKGVRKEVEVNGRQVLIFWYRNQIYAIQNRSPAEGAYSEGFIRAKFTQDYAIECPSTGSLFSLKDGSILSWYPNNAVLRVLTPKDTVGKMEIYPLKLTQDAILVDVSGSRRAVLTSSDKGGADTSLENNNVFSVMPTVYFEGMDPTQEEASLYQAPVAAQKLDPAIAVTAVATLGAVGVSGTLVCLYLENIPLLVGFWLVLGGGVAYAGYNYINREK